MKIYTKIILDKNNKPIEQKYYNYFGPISNCGIHYSYKNEKPKKAMEKQARREKKLAEKRAKKQAKSSFVKEKKEEDRTIPLDQVITLDHLTNPDKK